MSNEAWDYTVLRPIPGAFQDRLAYSPGEGIMAQVVQDLGLVVGEDVAPARPNSMPIPAGNASRAEWARYAEIQGMPQDKVDALTRDQLRNRFTVDEVEEPVKDEVEESVKDD